jgi:putative ABC transport system substrate-binding protein
MTIGNRQEAVGSKKLKFVQFALGALLFVLGSTSEAQQPTKVPRIGFLFGFSPSVNSDRVEAFRQGLRELGYNEGQNIAVEYRWADGKFDRLPKLAGELAKLNIDLAVTHGEAAIRALKQASKTMPIVVAVTGDLVQTGHAATLASPGGNITGLVDTSPELSGKRLELLKEVMPAVSRVAVVWNGANPVKILDFKETATAAQASG